ncbi:MAG TPA: DUF6139 family protein [Noviherbaspirillum sp.]
MKVDLYRRPDSNGKFSYLAVPEGRPIPDEATAVDWETADNNVDLDDRNQPIDGLDPNHALEQISAKGYAITPLDSPARKLS